MNDRITLLTGISMAALAVAIGAFGAHGLKEILASAGRVNTYELAVRYQFYHAFALIATAILMRGWQHGLGRYAALCFTGGIALFSGSLYVLSLTGITLLGAVTPFGGLLFIAGWLLLFTAAYKK